MKLIVLVVFIASICYACADDSCPNPNEVYNCCGTPCQRTCKNLNIYMYCIEKCVPGCFCRDGYVRQYDNGPCVPIGECPCSATASPTPTTPGYATVTFV
ncbi:AAEL005090-PA [Aedes aegypti]|uniref:AAEL005090-PA n=1 Tax=Aedes aegypti TaxID=7159 RepID=Q17B36_AEDAE|nr:AAEL005090-PA [Aedes aegypti]